MHCSRCAKEAPPGAKFCLECGAAIADPGAQTQLLDEDEGLIQLRTVQRILAGEFEVEREVGRGAMAIVYKAIEMPLHRRVALKVLPPSAPISRSMAERFKREARLAASLDHPNIIPVYRVGQLGTMHYIAMKFVEGLGLDDILGAQGPLPIPVVLHILRATTAALAYAHGQGIVHRDVKGANVLIDRDGRIMVSDFGIARATEDASLTATGSVVGTPYFMSPEQCASRKIGPQSDQYSLGVVAFQMLSGLVPFTADTLPGIMHHHFYTPVPDLRAARPDVPPALLTVVNRVLAKRPENRFATTEGMLHAIEAIPFGAEERMQGEMMLRDLARGQTIAPVQARPLPPLADPSRHTPITADAVKRDETRKSRTTGAIAAAALVVASAGAWGIQTLRGELATARLPARVEAPPVAPALASPVESRAATGPRRAPASQGVAGAGRDSQSGSVAATRPEAPVDSSKLGRVRIRAWPVDADILVDGRSLGRGVVLDSVLRAGTHRLNVRAPGYANFDSTLTIIAGQTTQVRRVELQASESKP